MGLLQQLSRSKRASLLVRAQTVGIGVVWFLDAGRVLVAVMTTERVKWLAKCCARLSAVASFA